MKKVLITSLLTTALALPVAAADYTIDTKGAHASVNFKVSHLGYSYIQGRFNQFEGQFSYDADNLEASQVSVTVDTTSLDSNHAERDKHLKSDDYINASKYSTAKFVSTKVIKKADGRLTVSGDMTLHGITKPAVIDAVFIGEGKDPWGGYRAGFEGTTRLNLAEYGIKGASTPSYVDLDIQIEGVRK